MEPSARGLGIFDCPMPHQQSTVQEMPPSPHDSEAWSHSSIVDQEHYIQNTQRPNISTADYDPFSSYNSGNNQGVLSAPPEEAPALVFCQTPPSTSMPSHRSSMSSSCSPPHQRAEYYTPRVKTEDPNEWHDQVLQRPLTTHAYSPFSTGVSPLTGPAEDLYRSHDWSKSTPTAYPMEYNPMMSDDPRPRFDAPPMLPSANRIKKKRQKTTLEEATHKCTVCDKLFKRSYNYKSHMETHNPQRKYPHPCTAMNGTQQCTKKFQRKTDLDRHYDSVHLKARNHRCNLCGNRFARRDTLRRSVLEMRLIYPTLLTRHPDIPKTAAPKGSSLVSTLLRPMQLREAGPALLLMETLIEHSDFLEVCHIRTHLWATHNQHSSHPLTLSVALCNTTLPNLHLSATWIKQVFALLHDGAGGLESIPWTFGAYIYLACFETRCGNENVASSLPSSATVGTASAFRSAFSRQKRTKVSALGTSSSAGTILISLGRLGCVGSVANERGCIAPESLLFGSARGGLLMGSAASAFVSGMGASMWMGLYVVRLYHGRHDHEIIPWDSCLNCK